MHPTPVAVVTGANRGLGLETTRQLLERGWTVVLAARSLDKARAAADSLGSDRVLPARLDVTSEADAAALAELVTDRFGRLDALVNNAGVILQQDHDDTATSDPALVLATVDTNAVGALRTTQPLLPLLRAAAGRGGANVVNVSSGMGAIAEMGCGHVGYRLSKASLNALTRILHNEHHGAGLRVNAVCPGWVRTDMGGASATRDVTEGAAGIVWAATLEPGGPSGGFFRDGRPIDW